MFFAMVPSSMLMLMFPQPRACCAGVFHVVMGIWDLFLNIGAVLKVATSKREDRRNEEVDSGWIRSQALVMILICFHGVSKLNSRCSGT
jgi:hypothetical protein